MRCTIETRQLDKDRTDGTVDSEDVVIVTQRRYTAKRNEVVTPLGYYVVDPNGVSVDVNFDADGHVLSVQVIDAIRMEVTG